MYRNTIVKYFSIFFILAALGRVILFYKVRHRFNGLTFSKIRINHFINFSNLTLYLNFYHDLTLAHAIPDE